MDSPKTTFSPLDLNPTRRAGFHEKLFLATMRSLKGGRLTLQWPDGTRRDFGPEQADLQADMLIQSTACFAKIIRSGGIGLGESYMDGDWTSPDLSALLQLLGRNQERFAWLKRGIHFAARSKDRIMHLSRNNRLGQAKENIAEHYDLSNEFYTTFLDSSLSYSSALYDSDDMTLEQAQEQKIRRILDLSGIQPGQLLLEIGSGWGALALCAASNYGARVITITLSEEQYALARQRVDEAGLSDRIEVRLQDYRHLDEQADAIVSVEMIEAVGHDYLPTYFDAIEKNLKPEGRAVIQAITIPDKRYATYTKSTDFIKKHIFPGGHLPSPGIIRKMVRKTDRLELESRFSFGHDYARTLREWHERFRSAHARVSYLGFDHRFQRKWAFYLSFCEAGFLEDLIDVEHVVMRKQPHHG